MSATSTLPLMRDVKFYMKKHIYTAIIISLFGIVFINYSADDIRKASHIFNTEWLDVIKAIFSGIVIGMILRKKSIRNYLENIPLGTVLTGKGIGSIGLGAIGFGFLGALIIYLKFGIIEFYKNSTECISCWACLLICIFLVSTWGRTRH